MNADVSVSELMDREYVGVSESDDLLQTVELLLREDAETAVVQRGSEHVGVLTARDVLSLLVEGPTPEEATVGDAMTESVPTVPPEMTLDGAADEMSTRSSGRLVVTNGTEPLGLISERDLLDSRTYQSGSGSAELAETVNGENPSTPAMDTAPGTGSTTELDDAENFQDQSICEVCGRLSSDLTTFNGQILCPDCREM